VQHAVLLDGLGVLGRAVSLVRFPAITPVAARELHHQRSRVTLATNGGSGDGERAAVAADERAGLARESLGNDVAVDQRRRRGRLQPVIGGAHAHSGRLQDIVTVDAADPGR